MDEIIENLKKAADKLASKIDDIRKIASPNELNSYSDLIMGMLRAEHIFISQEYIDSFCSKHDCKNTIDPHNVLLCLPKNTNNFKAIYANSVGPLKPNNYWKAFPKIGFMLYESYIKDDSWQKGDRGGCDKSMDFETWEIIRDECNDTYINIVTITLALLEKEGIIYKGSESEVMNQVMNHICIYETNYFPGIRGTNTNINLHNKKNGWATINRELNKVLIDFTQPTYIIGNHDSLGIQASYSGMFGVAKSPYKILKEKYHDATINDADIINSSYKKLKDARTTWTSLADSEHRVWLGSVHPGPMNWNTYWDANLADVIDWIVKFRKSLP